MKTLVVDAGTSSVRIIVFDLDGVTILEDRFPLIPSTPFPGLVEFDAAELAEVVLNGCRSALNKVGGVDNVAVTNQRASTVVWDRKSGEPVAPALGWQDLRTIGRCLELRAEGYRTAPNSTATKAEAILDAVDPQRSRDLCIGTVDSWLVWSLSDGNSHITDATNAAVTTLRTFDGTAWDNRILELLRMNEDQLPQVLDSAGELALASALPGSPVIAAVLGDQQASLAGQGCVANGLAKITFGTGAMLDVCIGSERPASETLTAHGTFPIIALQIDGRITWGLEAMMLSAGTNVEWLRDDLGIIDSAEHSAEVAAGCETTDGVQYVPALLGLGTPDWDYGARGALLGITRGTNRSHVVRAVLEGVAERAVDLISAIEVDSGFS
ncbi:MAG: FGGY family carbohydrate kinase, partial [Acidimicrobiales bacterium]